MEEKPISRPGLALKVSLRVVLFLPLTGALFFLSAGSLAFWNAWLLLATIFVLMAVMMTWLLIRDPALLAKRMRTKERRPAQKCFVAFSLVWVLGAFVLPGLDFRFGWSALPVWLVLAANGLMCLGFLLFALVLRSNSFASRVIEIQEGQRVIDTGPYSVVRHPMYSSTIIIYLAMPLVLGSLPALALSALFLVALPFRALNEEKLLVEQLPGYADYQQRVRWRLIPGIW